MVEEYMESEEMRVANFWFVLGKFAVKKRESGRE